MYQKLPKEGFLRSVTDCVDKLLPNAVPLAIIVPLKKYVTIRSVAEVSKLAIYIAFSAGLQALTSADSADLMDNSQFYGIWLHSMQATV